MCQHLYFYVFFLLATNKILSVESNLLDSITTDNPISSECGTSSITSGIIQPKVPNPGVPICKGSEDLIVSYALVNGIQNAQIFEQQPKENEEVLLLPCDNTELIRQLLQEFGVCPKKNRKCDACDFSYNVFIFTEIKGKKTQVCQGVRLNDGSILTVYGCTQIGQGLWIQFPNSDSKLLEVECMAGPNGHAISDGFADTIYIIRLILKSNCSSDGLTSNQYAGILVDAFTTINGELNATSQPLISGYLVVKDDCSSDKYSISCKPGLLSNNAGFIIVDKQDDLCPGFQGALFIGDDGQQYGMALYKPGILWNFQSAFPQLNTALDATRCAIPFEIVYL